MEQKKQHYNLREIHSKINSNHVCHTLLSASTNYTEKITGAWERSIKILSFAAFLTHAEVSKIPPNCCKFKRFKNNMCLRTNTSEAICQNSSVACYGVWIEIKCI